MSWPPANAQRVHDVPRGKMANSVMHAQCLLLLHKGKMRSRALTSEGGRSKYKPGAGDTIGKLLSPSHTKANDAIVYRGNTAPVEFAGARQQPHVEQAAGIRAPAHAPACAPQRRLLDTFQINERSFPMLTVSRFARSSLLVLLTATLTTRPMPAAADTAARTARTCRSTPTPASLQGMAAKLCPKDRRTGAVHTTTTVLIRLSFTSPPRRKARPNSDPRTTAPHRRSTASKGPSPYRRSHASPDRACSFCSPRL